MVDGVIVLYEQNETNFTSNGLGYLSDAIECTVSEELNGEYELEMEYPVDGIRYSEIQHRRILYVKPNPYEDPQPFRIYNINRPIDGRVEINARHISYDLSGYTVSESENKSIPFSTSPKMFCEKIPSAMTELNSGMPSFTFWTNSVEEYDSETYAEEGDELKEKHWICIDTPSSVRSLIGQFTEKYKGEFKFDKYAVKFYGPVSGQSEDDKHYRGTDSGVVLRYGKNLTDLMQEEDSDKGMYTHLYPYWSGTVNTTNTDSERDESSSRSEEKVVTMTNKLYPIFDHDVGYKRVLIYEVNSDWNEKHPNNTNDATPWPAEEDFEELCKEYIKNNELGIPKITLTASFIQLSRSAEYEDLKPLEKVLLGDTVSVLWEELGVDSTLKCTKTEYDALMDSYKSITLGNDANSSISSTVAATSSGLSGVTSSMSDKVSKEEFYNQTYDTALSTTSTNAVQNKVVTSKFNEMKRCCNEVKGDIAYLKEFVSSAGGTLSYGTDIPTGGKDGDGYVQVAQSSSTNPVTLSVGNNSGNWAVNNFTPSGRKYSFTVAGIGNPSKDIANIDAVNLTPDHEYRVNFTAKMSSNATYYNDGAYTFGVNIAEFNSLIMISHDNITRGTYDSTRRYQSFYEDNAAHNYSFTFRTGANEDKVSLSFSFHDVQDYNQVTLDVTNFTLVDTSSGDNEIIDLWFKIDGEWLVYSNESTFTYGYSLPTGGSDGDAYVQITSTPKDPTAIMTEGLIHNNFEVSNFTRSGSKFSFDISGTVDLTEENYTAVNIENLTPGREYRATFKINHNVPTSSLDSSYYRAGGSRWRRGFGFFINNGSNTKNINYAPTNPDNLWFATNLGFNEIRGWEGELLSVKSTKNYIPNIKFQHIYKDAGEQSYDLYFTPNSDKACLQFVFDDMVDEASCDMTVSDFEITYAGIPIIDMDSYGLSGSVFASAVWNSNWDAGQGITDYIPNESWTNWGGGNGEDNVIFGFSFTESQEMDRLRLNAWEGTEFDQPQQPVLRTLYLEGSTDSKAWNAEDKEWVNLLPSNSSVNIDYGWNNIDHIYFDINKGTYHDIRCRFVNNGNGKVEALQCFLRDEVQNENHVKDLFFKCDGEWLVYPRDGQEDEPVFTYGSEDPDGTTEGDIYAKVNDGTIDSISYKVNDTWLLGHSGGGSGGGSGFAKTLLWDSGDDEGAGAQMGTTYNLLDDLSKFDQIYIEFGTYIDRSQHGQYPIPVLPRYFDVDVALTPGYDQGMADYYQRYCYLAFTNTTFHITRQGCPGESSGYEPRPYKMYGIKFSGGGSERTDLLYSASGTTAPSTITLAHPYTDYEKLVVTVQTPAPAGNIGVASNTYYIDDFDTIEIIGGCSDIAYIWYTLTDATTLTKAAETDGYYVKSIRGIGSSS